MCLTSAHSSIETSVAFNLVINFQMLFKDDPMLHYIKKKKMKKALKAGEGIFCSSFLCDFIFLCDGFLQFIRRTKKVILQIGSTFLLVIVGTLWTDPTILKKKLFRRQIVKQPKSESTMKIFQNMNNLFTHCLLNFFLMYDSLEFQVFCAVAFDVFHFVFTLNSPSYLISMLIYCYFVSAMFVHFCCMISQNYCSNCLHLNVQKADFCRSSKSDYL